MSSKGSNSILCDKLCVVNKYWLMVTIFMALYPPSLQCLGNTNIKLYCTPNGAITQTVIFEQI